MYVEFRAGCTITPEDIASAGGSICRAVEDVLGIDVDQVDYWTYNAEEYDMLDDPDSPLYDMTPD